MKSSLHKIRPEKWQGFSKKQQVLNIAAELSRIYHQELGQKQATDQTKQAYERALELIDLTLQDPKWQERSQLYQLRDSLAALYLGKPHPVIVKFFYSWLLSLAAVEQSEG